MTRCPSCAGFQVGDVCETCVRRRRYGAVAVMIDYIALEDHGQPSRYQLEALEALAEIMIDRHRLIRAHRKELKKELNAEIESGARVEADAYDEGWAEGREH